MRVFVDGEYRDATPEEEKEAQGVQPIDEGPSIEERMEALEDKLRATEIILGVSE